MSKAYEVFVSYSRDDKGRVRPWVARMREGGVEVFFDTDSLVGGDGWREMIVDAIASSKAVIFVASGTAFASDFVPKELALAEQAKKKILPVFLEKVQPTKKAAFILADLHRIAAYDRPEEEVWAEIERALNEAGVVLKSRLAATPDPSGPAADGRKRRKRDDAWLEWDSANPSIEMAGASASEAPQNERRKKEEPRVMAFGETQGEPAASAVRKEREEPLDEVEGRCMAIGTPLPVDEPPMPERDEGEARWTVPETEESFEHRRGHLLWLGLLGVVLGAMVAGWGFRGGSLEIAGGKGKSAEGTPKTYRPEEPRPAPPTPLRTVPKPKSLAETAAEIVTRYYGLPGTGDILGQVALLADPLEDYFEEKPCTLAKAKEELAAYAKTWPRQTFELLGPVAAAERAGQGRVDCEAPVRFVSENEIVRMSGTFRGSVAVAFDGGPKIVAVREVKGSRQPSPLVFLPEGQERRAREFVRQAVEAGNSSPGTPAKVIAEMFAEKVSNYYKEEKSRKKIEEQTQEHQKLWPSRKYQIRGDPVVVSGLGTKNVSVEVVMDYLATRGDATGANRSSGHLKARYDLEFKNSGTPIIVGVDEIERFPDK